ncbi:hypothetical protein [Flavobacterium sp.]|uniref:hypothetical protein n=1 Tax=Flavobacterium sp. TaxID=239 RepID=UPI0039192613
MKKLINLLLLAIVVGCSNESENKNPESLLPPITQTGANTFGCLIDGNLFIPRDGTGTWSGPDNAVSIYGDPTGNNQYREIEVRDYKSERTAKILMHIQNLPQIGYGNYTINESNGMNNIDGANHTYLHCRVFRESTNSYQFYRSFENSGTINITRYQLIPNVSLFISGTFSCRVKNSANPNDIIEITNGRFDFNGATIPNAVFP